MRITKSRVVAHVTGEQAVIHFLPRHIRELGDVQKVASEIEQVACTCDVKLLVINFARLRQVTSALLGKLIRLNRDLKKLGIALRICSMAPEVEQAFRICRLDKLIPHFGTEAEALSTWETRVSRTK